MFQIRILDSIRRVDIFYNSKSTSTQEQLLFQMICRKTNRMKHTYVAYTHTYTGKYLVTHYYFFTYIGT